MALYTDNDVITLADLVALDPEVAEVAETEHIVVDGDRGIVRQAWSECGNRILEETVQFGYNAGYRDPILAWHTGLTGGRSSLSLSQVVVDDAPAASSSPLRTWLTYHALYLFFRACANRLVKDRYEEKAKRYELEAKKAYLTVRPRGIPVVNSPLACPGAVHETGTGEFADTDVTTVGTGGTGSTIDVAIAWRAAGADSNNISGLSRVVSIAHPDANVLTVSRAGLSVPPAFQPLLDRAITAMTPTHWRVYAAPQGSALRLQAELPIVTTIWTQPGAGAAAIVAGGMDFATTGQRADRFEPLLNTLQRA